MRWLCGKCFRKEGLSADDVALGDYDCQAWGKCEECGAIDDIFKIKK